MAKVHELYWRKPSNHLVTPACHMAESEWIKYFIEQRNQNIIPTSKQVSLITPNNQTIEVTAVFKQLFVATGLIIHSPSEPLLVGGIIPPETDTIIRPLRPFRPNGNQQIDSQYYQDFQKLLIESGFTTPDNLITILEALLQSCNIDYHESLKQNCVAYYA